MDGEEYRMASKREIIEFEPAVIGVVRKSGDIYVSRQHIDKTAYIYFLADTEFEPAIVGTVRKSGDIYVGRQHIGKTAYIYFLRNEGQPL